MKTLVNPVIVVNFYNNVRKAVEEKVFTDFYFSFSASCPLRQLCTSQYLIKNVDMWEHACKQILGRNQYIDMMM